MAVLRLSPLALGAIVLCLSALLLPANVSAATLKIATLSPPGSCSIRLMRAGCDEIAARTDGRVKFKFYPGGVMGDDATVIRKIRFGQLQGAALTVGALTPFYTDIQVYGLPMLFQDYAEVDAVRAVIDADISAGLEEQGWVVFGLGEAGFAYAMSKRPGATLEAARDQKVWIPSGDAGALAAIQGFGITPVPLSIADVLTGLQTDLIEAVAVPPVAALALQWYTQVDFMLDLPLLYVYGALTVDAKAFGRLDEGDQIIVREVMGRQSAAISALNRADDGSAREALSNQGIEFKAPPTPDALADWEAGGRAARVNMVETGAVSAALYERVLEILEAHRAAR